MKKQNKRRGNDFGFNFFKMLIHAAGLRGAYGFLYIVCIYYLIFDFAAVKAAMAYISRRFPESNFLVKYFRVYKLFVSQGKQLIDRYAAAQGGKVFDITLRGYDEFCDLLKSGKGFVVVGAHVGNWQVAMTILRDLQKTVYLIMRPEDNPAALESLKVGKNEAHLKFISPDGFLGGMVEATNALTHGGVVCFLGDRNYGFDSVGIKFLGGEALFPYGAFHLAACTRAPLVVLLSAKTAHEHYELDARKIFSFRYEAGSDKKEQLKKWVQKYAHALESYVHKYPYQCFLFHDIWVKR
jgi:predicted LPLAT superfamily acyltransferase